MRILSLLYYSPQDSKHLILHKFPHTHKKKISNVFCACLLEPTLTLGRYLRNRIWSIKMNFFVFHSFLMQQQVMYKYPRASVTNQTINLVA